MIDTSVEHLIRLSRIPEPDVPESSRQYVAIRKAYRWASKGLRDRLPLETVKIGGRIYTSREALQRFEKQSDTYRPTESRKKKIEAAQAELRRMGVSTQEQGK